MPTPDPASLPDPTFCPDNEPHQLPPDVKADLGWTTCERCGLAARVTPTNEETPMAARRPSLIEHLRERADEEHLAAFLARRSLDLELKHAAHSRLQQVVGDDAPLPEVDRWRVVTRRRDRTTGDESLATVELVVDGIAFRFSSEDAQLDQVGVWVKTTEDDPELGPWRIIRSAQMLVDALDAGVVARAKKAAKK